MSNNIPRRARVDLYVPAETAIREAMLAVEAMGADVLLTKAVVLLGEAQTAVADYVDAQPLTSERTREMLGAKEPIPFKVPRWVVPLIALRPPKEPQ